MKTLWSDETRYATWLRVELAALGAMERHGRVPRGTSQALRRKVKRIDPKRIDELEAVTRHDVIAFLAAVEEMAGEPARLMHFGMTSSDVLDTAFALQLVEATRLITKELGLLMEALETRAMSHRRTLMVGRTHGIHAQPTSLGLVFALWHEEMKRNLARLEAAGRDVACGKLSGAVGTYGSLSPAIEEEAMKTLGLRPEPVSSQIVQRDRHAAYFCALAVCGASIEKIALTVRHWQRTEVAEAFEPFGGGQKGSSAMPHKRNPILAENLCGLSRLLRAHALAALENVALWHERDISHSSVERVIGPDGTTLLHYMLRRAAGLVAGLEVRPGRMLENLDMTGGLVYSEQILNHLILSGLPRQEAYGLVQRDAMEALRSGSSFKKLLLADAKIARRIGKKTIEEAFDPRRALEHADTLMRRVFKHDER
jgi:adenylosuccinate lyase